MTIPRYKWQPTTAEIAAAAGIDPAEVIRFDHNTTPWPTDWTVELATTAARSLNEYPGASYFPLRRAAAARGAARTPDPSRNSNPSGGLLAEGRLPASSSASPEVKPSPPSSASSSEAG